MHISKEKALSLRGLCALSVLCSHLISNLNIGTDYKIVSLVSGMMGYIPVTIFFYLSGYGLMTSYTLNGDKYIKEFPRHRLFPYYIKYLIVATVYLLFRIVFSESITQDVLKSVLFGGTIVKFGWYFQTQLLLYIFFYLSFEFLKNRKKQLIVLSIIIVVFWCICILTKLDETFFITTTSFLLGIFWTTIVKKVKHDWFRNRGGGIPACVYPHLVVGNAV